MLNPQLVNKSPLIKYDQIASISIVNISPICDYQHILIPYGSSHTPFWKVQSSSPSHRTPHTLSGTVRLDPQGRYRVG